MSESIKGWQTLEQYRADGRSAFFPNEQSLRWLIRQHRSELVKAGAMAMPGRVLLIEPGKFDQVVLQIAQRRVKAA